MTVSLVGLGTAQPKQRVSQEKAAEFARRFTLQENKPNVLEALYRRTGVHSRGSVLLEESPDDEVVQQFYPRVSPDNLHGPTTGARMQRYAAEASPLATEAARRALEDAEVEPSSVTHLITVSCTGFVSPGVEFALIRNLPLSPAVARTNIGFMGCHGAINGLRLGHSFAASAERARVLVCAVELCSLHYQYGWQAEKIVANALFADGAAAAVLMPGQPREAGPQLHAVGSCVFPGGQDEMSWLIGDHGFEMTLSARVPEIITRSLSAWCESWLRDHGYSISDIQGWAVHPGGPRILSSAADALQLVETDLQLSKDVLADCGNMSSPTVFFILQRMRDAGAPLPWVAIAFGPGLVVEAALFVP